MCLSFLRSSGCLYSGTLCTGLSWLWSLARTRIAPPNGSMVSSKTFERNRSRLRTSRWPGTEISSTTSRRHPVNSSCLSLETAPPLWGLAIVEPSTLTAATSVGAQASTHGVGAVPAFSQGDPRSNHEALATASEAVEKERALVGVEISGRAGLRKWSSCTCHVRNLDVVAH